MLKVGPVSAGEPVQKDQHGNLGHVDSQARPRPRSERYKTVRLLHFLKKDSYATPETYMYGLDR